MQRIYMMLCSLFLVMLLTACNAINAQQIFTISSVVPTPPITQRTDVSNEKAMEKPIPPENMSETEVPKTDTASSIQITMGNTSFSATLVKNAATDALIELLRKAPVVINMSDYSGFEKVGALGTNLPTDNSSITTGIGDIVLYNGNQIVVFYGTHSWDYTRLGKIDDLAKWQEALGDGDVTITFSIE